MFRKQGGFAWSEANVWACARRQTAVLDTAVSLVKPNGRLIYSTCTFSPEENEQVMAQFLQEHPEFKLESVPQYEGFGNGRPAWV